VATVSSAATTTTSTTCTLEDDEDSDDEVEVTFGSFCKDEDGKGDEDLPADDQEGWVSVDKQKQHRPKVVQHVVTKLSAVANNYVPQPPSTADRWLNKQTQKSVRDLRTGETYRGVISGVLRTGNGYFVTFGNDHFTSSKDGFVRGNLHADSPPPKVGDWCIVRVHAVDVSRNKVDMVRLSGFV